MQVILSICCAFIAGFAAGFGVRASMSAARRRKLRRELGGSIAHPFILPSTSSLTDLKQSESFDDTTAAASTPNKPKPAASSHKLH